MPTSAIVALCLCLTSIACWAGDIRVVERVINYFDPEGKRESPTRPART